MRKLLIIALLLVLTAAHAQDNIIVTLLPQVHVFFDLGSSTLSASAKRTIDSMIYADLLPPGKSIGIIGHADIIGEEKSNIELSKKRADAVAHYLQSMGIDSTQIESITGKGEIARPEKTGGYPKDRKVVIIPGGFNKPEKIVWGEDGTLIATLLFKYTSTKYYPYVSKMLDTVVATLKKNTSMIVNINGFVCCFNYDNLPPFTYRSLEGQRFKDTARLGGAERLSITRANIIAEYLINRGISAERIKCHAYGYLKNKMLDNGTSAHGIDRVEIRAVKNK